MACHTGLLFSAERPDAVGAGIHTETVPEFNTSLHGTILSLTFGSMPKTYC